MVYKKINDQKPVIEIGRVPSLWGQEAVEMFASKHKLVGFSI